MGFELSNSEGDHSQQAPALAGAAPETYWQFPARPEPAAHPGFRPAAFMTLGLAVGIACGWVALRIWRQATNNSPPQSPPTRFQWPWWGWGGLALMSGAWFVAWTRLPVFAPVQAHTFTPLWVGAIVTTNALAMRATGQCAMFHRPRAFLALVPLSALFWWTFEYLNLHVGNWHYQNAEQFSDATYALLASLAFATVIPAVLSMSDLVGCSRVANIAFTDLPRLGLHSSSTGPAIVAILSALALIAVGAWPQVLFPLIWLAPISLFVSLRIFAGYPSGFEALADGDWRPVAIPALGALACGFLWEMWNHASEVRWIYTVPYVHGWQLFEMPILGYAGYLPFGVECVAIATLVHPGPFRWQRPL